MHAPSTEECNTSDNYADDGWREDNDGLICLAAIITMMAKLNTINITPTAKNYDYQGVICLPYIHHVSLQLSVLAIGHTVCSSTDVLSVHGTHVPAKV